MNNQTATATVKTITYPLVILEELSTKTKPVVKAPLHFKADSEFGTIQINGTNILLSSSDINPKPADDTKLLSGFYLFNEHNVLVNGCFTNSVNVSTNVLGHVIDLDTVTNGTRSASSIVRQLFNFGYYGYVGDRVTSDLISPHFASNFKWFYGQPPKELFGQDLGRIVILASLCNSNDARRGGGIVGDPSAMSTAMKCVFAANQYEKANVWMFVRLMGCFNKDGIIDFYFKDLIEEFGIDRVLMHLDAMSTESLIYLKSKFGEKGSWGLGAVGRIVKNNFAQDNT